MTTSQVLHAIAEVTHAFRPAWDRAGIYAACHALAATRPLDQVAHAAIDAAMDKTANTPAVIATRDRSWQPTLAATQPPPARHVLHDQRPAPDVTQRGASNARQALAKARAQVDDDRKIPPTKGPTP